MRAAGSPPVSAADRAALLRKYQLLARWRRAKDRAHAPGQRPDAPPDADLAGREAMRSLAAEFPGALRELDRLGAAELERRVEVLARAVDAPASAAGREARAADRDGDEAWIPWILAYHRELERVLVAKRTGRGGPPSPEGRASLAVLRTIAARFGRPAEEIAGALFPPRQRP